MFTIGPITLKSRLILGTGKYDDSTVQNDSLHMSGTDCITFAVRRMNLYESTQPNPLRDVNLDDYIKFPNTAGATSVDDAMKIAKIAHAAGLLDMVKVEMIGDSKTLLPDPLLTYEVCGRMLDAGYIVCPYIQSDVVLAKRLESLGVHAVMPLAAPIGTGLGITDPIHLKYVIDAVNIPVIVDAGIGSPKDASFAMELGADAVLLNSAVARANDPVKMAQAMKLGVEAGRLSYEAGRIPTSYHAIATSPLS